MNKLIIIIVILMLMGCHSSHMMDRYDYKVDTRYPAVGKNGRINAIVLHYTALNDEDSLNALTQQKVSAHYLILRNPKKIGNKPVVLQLVPEDKRAWHAGSSYWRNRTNLNDTSLGIEIVNLGYTPMFFGKRWYPFNDQQRVLIERLTKDLVKRYDIKPTNVLAHSDIAPLRKHDPGPLFFWERLAKIGVGAWPDQVVVKKYIGPRNIKDLASVANIQKLLAQYGYTIPQTGQLDPDTKKVISAFQMHFRPSDFSGRPDAQTEAIAAALLEKYSF
ncbi:N-acetylmuramoyl-L-alanine amidase [Candidatus Williamhamiltonella defendens]|uniref:N-acetylmuramoyl-L-alanine amidase n=1 Tax=Candidatus Hamiltonella defensa (Bemisia tabaci) TaxID=672795 RepID=A0A249E158_9ENTR|nr:N-acetylmuramoyl-L-alanine amidase [Candidatus Hamiltonella defensa]ASX26897.1 N-acetylmuramoyl-L-alanine amidase [Candidatus Hamiltonella defensa (Bemisia tabaci)]CED79690.1 N-acetylmuramoyl-L-alanine amidase AmiD [Candidatus Hamiltonella defensa (Bemisia tabaci)]